MRKILTSIIILCALIGGMTANAQFRYGPTAGADITTLKFKQNLIGVGQSVGFSAGVQGELMFPGIGFGIDIGLRYEQRGAKLHLGDKPIWASEGYGVERTYLHYLDIPFHLRFKYTRLNGVENTIAPFVYAGPTFSILMGHNKIEALKYAGGELGIEVGAGAEIFRNWQLSGAYTWGMTYALKTRQLTDFSAHSRTWDIRLTYFF